MELWRVSESLQYIFYMDTVCMLEMNDIVTLSRKC